MGIFQTKNLMRAAVLSPIATVLLCASAHASTTLPPRKPGLWITTMVMHMNMPGMPPDTGNTPIISAMCADAQTDAIEMKRMTGDNGLCQKFDIEGSGDTYTMTGTCTDPMGGGTMTTQGTITIESENAMHIESQTNSSHINGNMVADSKWSGACPAGVVPGDLGHMQDGVFVKLTNINGMPKTP